MLPRWQRHWWESAVAPNATASPEPKVIVDPSLYVEAAPRLARGSIPPPIVVGPHASSCELEDTTVVDPEDLRAAAEQRA